jgi:hypothetical protein
LNSPHFLRRRQHKGVEDEYLSISRHIHVIRPIVDSRRRIAPLTSSTACSGSGCQCIYLFGDLSEPRRYYSKSHLDPALKRHGDAFPDL